MLRKSVAYLGLGSNSGNRLRNIVKASYLINRASGIKFLKFSSIYKSKPWGYTNQKEFYNAVVKIETALKPHALLKVCKKIERKMGRRKRFRWGPRTVDIDILIYGNVKKNTKVLTIPHKYIKERVFVLVPLVEIDKNIRLNGRKIDSFIDGLKDKLELVKKRGVF